MAPFMQLLKSRQIVNTTNIEINAETVEELISDVNGLGTIAQHKQVKSVQTMMS